MQGPLEHTHLSQWVRLHHRYLHKHNSCPNKRRLLEHRHLSKRHLLFRLSNQPHQADLRSRAEHHSSQSSRHLLLSQCLKICQVLQAVVATVLRTQPTRRLQLPIVTLRRRLPALKSIQSQLGTLQLRLPRRTLSRHSVILRHLSRQDRRRSVAHLTLSHLPREPAAHLPCMDALRSPSLTCRTKSRMFLLRQFRRPLSMDCSHLSEEALLAQSTRLQARAPI